VGGAWAGAYPSDYGESFFHVGRRARIRRCVHKREKTPKGRGHLKSHRTSLSGGKNWKSAVKLKRTAGPCPPGEGRMTVKEGRREPGGIEVPNNMKKLREAQRGIDGPANQSFG